MLKHRLLASACISARMMVLPPKAMIMANGPGVHINLHHNLIEGVPLLLGGSAGSVNVSSNVFTGGSRIADMDEVGEFTADGNVIV